MVLVGKVIVVLRGAYLVVEAAGRGLGAKLFRDLLHLAHDIALLELLGVDHAKDDCAAHRYVVGVLVVVVGEEVHEMLS